MSVFVRANIHSVVGSTYGTQCRASVFPFQNCVNSVSGLLIIFGVNYFLLGLFGGQSSVTKRFFLEI